MIAGRFAVVGVSPTTHAVGLNGYMPSRTGAFGQTLRVATPSMRLHPRLIKLL